jgi:soluble lytic murein transglycosylase-like protein
VRNGATAICVEPSVAGRLPPRLARWATFFDAAARTYSLDPFFLAAICDRESLGGDALTPPGPTGVGDSGHGRGLMQLDDRAQAQFCAERLGDGTPTWQDAESNILAGAKVLFIALQALGSDYPAAVCAYNAGVNTARQALAALPAEATADQRVAALDRHTTGGNYVSDVLRRRDAFLKADPTQGA